MSRGVASYTTPAELYRRRVQTLVLDNGVPTFDGEVIVRDGFGSFYFHPFLSLLPEAHGRGDPRARPRVRQPGVALTGGQQ